MTLPAGDLEAWAEQMRSALRDGGETDVPCGTCTACCRSGQFVHIAPDETRTLARIPRQLLFPAPGRPEGHVLLGYDERGHCPMLGDGGCTIYADRPRTCRTYDCRVFAAAGVHPDDKPLVAAQAARWRFDGAGDRAAAMRAAAAWLAQHVDALPERVAPRTATQLAVLAVEVHGAFTGAQAPTLDDVLAQL